MEEIANTLSTYVATYGLNVVAALAIFIIGKWLSRLLSNALEKGMTKANVDATLAKFAKNISYFALLAFVILAAIGKLGVQTTSFVAVIGAAGLAVGFALQGSLSNFAAGVLLIMFRPFKVGDYVEAGGTGGTVAEVQIFNTVLNHPDNRKQIIPNAQVMGSTITNFSDIETRRIDLVVGISYEDDLLKAKQLLEGLVASFPGVLQDPEPLVAVSELADSSVNFVVRPWVKPADYWGVRFALTEKIKLTLDENGITIPYPQQSVHVEHFPSTANTTVGAV